MVSAMALYKPTKQLTSCPRFMKTQKSQLPRRPSSPLVSPPLYNLHLEPKDCSCAIHHFSAPTAQLATDFTLSLCISLKNPQVTTGLSLIGFAVTWLYKER